MNNDSDVSALVGKIDESSESIKKDGAKKSEEKSKSEKKVEASKADASPSEKESNIIVDSLDSSEEEG